MKKFSLQSLFSSITRNNAHIKVVKISFIAAMLCCFGITGSAQITGASSVCIGDSTLLSDATAGGTWSSSDMTVGTVDALGEVEGISSGTTIISYVTSGGTDVTVITVYPLPNVYAVTGGGSFCTGTACPHVLLSSSDAGITYQVYCGGALVGFPLSGTGGALDFGPECSPCTYTILATNPITGCSINMAGSATVTVIGSISPIIGEPIVCIGLTTPLTDTTHGGTWSSSNTAVGSVGSATGIVRGISAGTTTITYTVGACYTTMVVTVPAGAGAPIMHLHDLCPGSTEVVYDTDLGGAWSSSLVTVDTVGLGGTDSARVSAITITSGVASVSYTLPSGCQVIDTLLVDPLTVIVTRDSTICAESSISYSALPGGGTWASSNTGVAIVGTGTGIIFGVSSGSAIITYTSPQGCTDTTLIFVNPLPAEIGGALGICLGDSTRLTDATSGGFWNSNPTTVASINSVTGEVYGLTTGTAIITYTLLTGCLITATMAVNSVPGFISGPGNVCVGSMVTLTDDSLGGDWSSSNTGVATIGTMTGIVTGVSFGTTIITYQSGAGCYSLFTFMVDTLPVITPGPIDSVCIGGPSLRLSGSPILCGTWTSSNTSVATVDITGEVTGRPLSGSAIITYTLCTGCYATDTIVVNPAPDPIVGINSICLGDSTVLTDVTTGGTWVSDNPPTALITFDSSTEAHVLGVLVGSAIISYVLPTGCITIQSVSITPVPGPIMGNSTVCAGLVDSLTDAVPGGIWTSSNTSLAMIGSLSGIVTTVATVSSGSITISYTLGTCLAEFHLDIYANAPITGPDSVCAGSTITIADSDAFAGLTWTYSGAAVVSSTLDSTANVTGIEPGTATITFTAVNGCTDTLVVTVNPVPFWVEVNNTVCVGDSFSVLSSIPGGEWTSSGGIAVDSLRDLGGGAAVIIGEGPGVSIISYTLSTGCGIAFTLTVNPLPMGMYPPDSLCQGLANSIIFSDSTGGTGIWSVTPGTIAEVGSSTGLVTGLEGGTATLTYTLGTGCFATEVIQVDSLGPISGPLNVCIGNVETYTDYPIAGTWSNDNPAVGTIDPGSGIFTSGPSTGTTDITYTTPSGCYAVITVTVDPLPGPILGDTMAVCVNAIITLADDSTGGTWSSAATTIAFANSITGNVQGISAGTAMITYMLPTTCFTTAFVTVNPLPAHIVGNLNLCLTHVDTTILTDPTGGGTWSSSDLAVGTINSSSGILHALSVGTTVVTYTLVETGCFITAVVTVHPSAVISVVTPHEICIGGSDVLTASSAPPGTFTWSPAYALSTTVGATTVASPTVTTVYTVTATTIWGCISDTSVQVLVDSLLRYAKIVGKDSICAGTCDSLKGSGRDGTYFSWKPAVGLSCTICDSPIACPDVTEIYTATAIDAYGCRAVLTFTVTVMPLPRLSVFENPTIVCRGTPKQLLAYGAWSYFWSPPYFLSCDTCSNPVATDTANFIYELLGKTQFGCEDSISVRVSVLDTNYNRAGDDTIICLGGSAYLSAYSHSVNGNLDIPSYRWYDNDSGKLLPATGIPDPQSNTVYATPDTTTLYDVVIDENVCFSDTIPVLVVVDSLPIVHITASPPNITVIAGTAVQLTTTVTVDTAATFLWTPAISLSCNECPNPIATPSVNTTYNVAVVSTHGCISSDTITIDIVCSNSEVFIPNTFTPNGNGNGLNSIFFVSAKGISNITRMSVYNRWGQLVFQANNIPPDMPAYGWDGTFKGIVLQPDVFDYVVDVVCELGQTYEYTGSISIVR